MGNAATLQSLFYLAHIVGSLPWLLVMLAGGVVCLARLSARPRESWLVGSAIGLSLFASMGLPQLVGMMVNLIPGLLSGVGNSSGSMWSVRLLFGLPSSILQATAWGLILYAAFGEGSGPRSKYLIEDDRSEPESR